MSTERDILSLLDEAQANPQRVGLDLRLDLASIVIQTLAEKGWTQKDLALAAGMKEPAISRIVHSDTNCEFDTAGRILFALGIDAALTVKEKVESTAQTPLVDEVFQTYGDHYAPQAQGPTDETPARYDTADTADCPG